MQKARPLRIKAIMLQLDPLRNSYSSKCNYQFEDVHYRVCAYLRVQNTRPNITMPKFFFNIKRHVSIIESSSKMLYKMFQKKKPENKYSRKG